LILSFASECLDFDIDEIDEFKVALTEIVSYLKPYLSIDEPFKLSLYHENDVLETMIIARIYRNSFVIDETSPVFIVARSLLDELSFNNKEDGTFLVKMVKQKRGNNDRYRQTLTEDKKRDELIVKHMWIVDYIARKFSSGDPNLFEDLKSVGNIGLIKAADNYCVKKGTTFPTYATVLIQGEIRHYLRDRADVVRIPRKYVSYYKTINNAINEHISKSGTMPTVKEIASITGLSDEIILEALEAGFAKYPLSMDDSVMNEEEDIKIKDTVASPSDEATYAIDKMTINRALQKLDDVERKSIELKYKNDLTNEEIAEKMGLKTGKINRSIKKGLDKMKKYLLESENN